LNFKSVVIGGTGATGRKVLKQLSVNERCSQITSIGRRELDSYQMHDKINHIVTDTLLDLSKVEQYWVNHDVFFNCIGTTRKKAGGADQFHKIEYGISNEAARVASKSNIPHASIISASGANHNLWSKKWIHPLFYSKTMGEKEQTVLSNHSFKYTSIFKPGMLIRHQDKNSIYDKILKTTGTGLSVKFLAKAMINDAESVLLKKRKAKNRFIVGNKTILQI
tara:strand:+ start:627 stop:1292 length:666 start_codon:yes stop_codon:yes gene_type:complete